MRSWCTPESCQLTPTRNMTIDGMLFVTTASTARAYIALAATYRALHSSMCWQMMIITHPDVVDNDFDLDATDDRFFSDRF